MNKTRAEGGRQRKGLAVILVGAFLVLSTAASGMAMPATEQGLLRIKKIDQSRYPRMTLHLGLTTTERAVDFKVKENGRLINDVKVRYKVNKQPVAVTLVMDVSGSMKGQPIDDAKAAAKLFIERAHPNDRISIVAFSSTVTRISDLTSDKQKLYQAIEGLRAQGETAVYDALIESLSAAQSRNLQNQSIILLSDGGDTASKNPRGAVADLAGRLKVPVSVITLQSDEFNPAPLEEIAGLSEGRVLTAVSSDALQRLYDGLAAELHEGYQLTYISKTKKPQAKVDVDVNAGGRLLRASETVTSLPQIVKAVRGTATSKQVNRWNRLSDPRLAAGLAFFAVFLLVLALANLFAANPNTLAQQLKYYDQLRGRRIAENDKPTFDRAHGWLLDSVKRASNRYDFTAYAQTKLEQAGLPVKSHEYVTMHLLAVVVAAMAAVFLTGLSSMSVLMVALVVVGPLLAVQIKIEKRQALFRDQLPDMLDMLANSMRAGYGLQQAIAAAGREAREPTAGELQRVSNQVQMGMALEDALARLANRVGDPTFKWVVLAISIHRETGGNLAEILDNLSSSLRQRETMRRQLKTLTAEGRLSAIILIVLPFVEATIMSTLNPGYMSLLLTTLPGLMMLTTAIGLMAIGGVWMKNITNIEV